MQDRSGWRLCSRSSCWSRRSPRPRSSAAPLQGTVTDSQQGVVSQTRPSASPTPRPTSRARRRRPPTASTACSASAPGVVPRRSREGRIPQGATRERCTVGISETLRLDFTLEVSGVAGERDRRNRRRRSSKPSRAACPGASIACSCRRCRSAAGTSTTCSRCSPASPGAGSPPSISGGGGADDSFAGESAPRINASGQRDEANSFTVDDTSTNGVARGGITNLTPNTESVEEVRVVVEQLLGGGRPQHRRADPGDHQGAAPTSSAAAAPTISRTTQLSARNVFETSVPEFSKNQFGYSLGGPIVRRPASSSSRRTKGCGRPARAARRSRSRLPSSATSSCRRGPTASRRSCCGTLRRRSIPTSNFRDLGSPAPGANVIGPADGILDVGSAFFVPEAWRDGDQFSARVDYELTPGKDRLYGNLYRTTSYAVTGGIRPAFNRADAELRTFGNVNYTRTFSATKLNEFRGGVMRLVGLPETPAASRDPGHHHHRRHRVRHSRAIRTAGGRRTGTSRTSSRGSRRPPAEDGRRAAADVRLGGEHQQLHPGLQLLEPPEFRQTTRRCR